VTFNSAKDCELYDGSKLVLVMFVYDGCLFVLILDCDSQANQIIIMVGLLKRDIQTSQGSWIKLVLGMFV
jgi:hypothetical protein